MKANSVGQRDEFVDVAKGIAMLLVVRIHTEVFDVINAPYPVIAVPFFFFISGFYDNTDKPLKKWLPKSFRRLFLVGLMWIFISFVYLSLLHYIKDRTIPISFSLNRPIIAGGVTWFLFALFYAKCLAWLVTKTRIPKLLAVILLVLFGGWISRFDLPLLIDEGIGALPFYYAGKISYPYIKSHINQSWWLALLGLACIILMPMDWFPWVFVSYTEKTAYLYPCLFMMTACSFMTVLWLSKKLENQKWLANFGQQTLGILVLHPLLLHTCAVILNRVMVKGTMPWIITFLGCYVLVCILCYYLSVLISKHIPILLGGK